MGCHSFSIIRLAGCAVIKFLPSINCSKFVDVRTHDKWLIGDEVSLPWGIYPTEYLMGSPLHSLGPRASPTLVKQANVHPKEGQLF